MSQFTSRVSVRSLLVTSLTVTSIVSASFVSTSAFAKTIVVTPDTLRTALYSGDTSVISGLNSVYQAKEEVTRARANLLPGLGLSATLGGKPNFAISAISVLLPFLLPSNWHALDATKHQLTANGYAYHLVLLNDYASVLSLYMQIQGDMALRSVYVEQRANLRKIAEVVADEVSIGTATRADLAQALAQVQLAEAQISQVEELMAREKAAIRKVMGASLSTELEFSSYHMSPLSSEGSSPRTIFDRVSESSPEQRQIDSLIEAAREAKYSTAWSFLSGSSLSVSPNFGQSSFGSLTQTTGLNLGFGYFPAVQLSNLNVAQMKIRKRELLLEQANVIESAVNSVREAKDQVDFARKARENYKIALEAELDKYRLGQTDLVRVFTVSNYSTVAAATHVRAIADLDSQRVTLNRVMITNQFAKIPTCHLQNAGKSGGGVFGFFKGIFGSKKKRYVSVDEICRPSAEAADIASGRK